MCLPIEYQILLRPGLRSVSVVLRVWAKHDWEVENRLMATCLSPIVNENATILIDHAVGEVPAVWAECQMATPAGRLSEVGEPLPVRIPCPPRNQPFVGPLVSVVDHKKHVP